MSKTWLHKTFYLKTRIELNGRYLLIKGFVFLVQNRKFSTFQKNTYMLKYFRFSIVSEYAVSMEHN